MENITGIISQTNTAHVQLEKLSDYTIVEVFDVSKESSNHSDALILSFSLDSVPRCPFTFTGGFTGAYQKHTWNVRKGIFFGKKLVYRIFFGKKLVYRIFWLICASL